MEYSKSMLTIILYVLIGQFWASSTDDTYTHTVD